MSRKAPVSEAPTGGCALTAAPRRITTRLGTGCPLLSAATQFRVMDKSPGLSVIVRCVGGGGSGAALHSG